jgi:hypothetical protein
MSWKPHTLTTGLLAGKHYQTQQAYQNALARAHGLRSYAAMRQESKTVGERGFTWGTFNRATAAIGDLAQGKTLEQAARAHHIDPATIRSYRGADVERRGGRITIAAAKQHIWTPGDHQMNVITFDRATGVGGQGWMTIPDPAERSTYGKYLNAVGAYVTKGDGRELRHFQNRLVHDKDGKRYRLITDMETLDILAAAGALKFEEVSR